MRYEGRSGWWPVRWGTKDETYGFLNNDRKKQIAALKCVSRSRVSERMDIFWFAAFVADGSAAHRKA